ncbi:MAG: site-specific integrase [Flavisolibacter sp.]
MTTKHTFSLCPYLKKGKTHNEQLVPVYLRITMDGARTEISTKTLVNPQKWDARKGRLKGSTEDVQTKNAFIITHEHRAREIYNRLLEKGKPFRVQEIRDELTGMVHKRRTLLQTLKCHVDDMESRGTYSRGTVKNWKVTRGHLQIFLEQQYHRKDISFKELDENFLHDFDSFARKKWQCKTNAVLKHLQRIGKVVKKAVSKGWLDKNPFLGMEAKWEKTHRTFLTLQELQNLEEKTFSVDRLERVRDIFAFSCYTGLAYVDIEKLTLDDVVIGIDGKKWIYTFREKTKGKSNIPLLAPALLILEKYKDHPISLQKGKLLPLITNIKTNEYLKEIADLCGVKKRLTFHMARHTFATTIALSNGVPMETVSNMLGHTKITTTQIYAKVLENKVSDDMLALEKKLKKGNQVISV